MYKMMGKALELVVPLATDLDYSAGANGFVAPHAEGNFARLSIQGTIPDQLVKVNVQAGTAQIWHSPHCYPGEPAFVSAPDAISEDIGVVLSIVLNVQT